MTDKELLEAAANAAGIAVVPCSCSNPQWPFKHDEAVSGKSGHWNPLTDDGDALRLAVKLGMVVYINNMDRCTNAYFYYGPMGAVEQHGDDAEAATRRAVVRAAAAPTPKEIL